MKKSLALGFAVVCMTVQPGFCEFNPALEYGDQADQEIAEENAMKGKSGKNTTTHVQRIEEAVDPSTLAPEPYLNEAIKLVKEKRLVDALEKVKKAIELKPLYYEAWYEAALIHQLMGKNNLAIREYQALLARRPGTLMARVNLGSLLGQEKRFEEGEEQLKKAIDTHFYSFPAHYNLANLYYAQGRMEEALKKYRVCLKLSPDNAMVHNNLGVIFMQRDYLEEAYQEFRQAANLEPTNKTFLKNLSLIKKKIAARQNPDAM